MCVRIRVVSCECECAGVSTGVNMGAGTWE